MTTKVANAETTSSMRKKFVNGGLEITKRLSELMLKPEFL
jgi:hypothetical protein